MQAIVNDLFYLSILVCVGFTIAAFVKVGNKEVATNLKLNLFVWYGITIILMVLR